MDFILKNPYCALLSQATSDRALVRARSSVMHSFQRPRSNHLLAGVESQKRDSEPLAFPGRRHPCIYNAGGPRNHSGRIRKSAFRQSAENIQPRGMSHLLVTVDASMQKSSSYRTTILP